MKRTIKGYLAAAALLVAVLAMPCRGEAVQKQSLDEAYFLAKCVMTCWAGQESFKRLDEGTHNEGRRALYLMHWMLAMSDLLDGKVPLIVNGDPAKVVPQDFLAWGLAGTERLEGAIDRMEVPAVVFMRSASSSDRSFAAGILADGIEAMPEAPDLEAILLNDASKDVRRMAAYGLGRATPSARVRRTLPFLAVHTMLDSEFEVRKYSARSLGHLVGAEFPLDDGLPSAETVAAAAKWIRSHYDVSILPGEAAGAPPAGADAPPLESLKEAYCLAKCAASGWRDKAAYQELMAAVQTKNLRAYCLLNRMFACLAESKGEAPVIGDAHEERRALLEQEADEAKGALAEMHDEALLAWAMAVRSGVEWEREMAAEALGAYGDDPDAVNLLILLLNDPNANVRDSAAYALGDADANPASKQALPFLAVRVLCEPDSHCRSNSAYAFTVLAGSGEKFGWLSPRAIRWSRVWIEQHCDLSTLRADGAGMWEE